LFELHVGYGRIGKESYHGMAQLEMAQASDFRRRLVWENGFTVRLWLELIGYVVLGFGYFFFGMELSEKF